MKTSYVSPLLNFSRLQRRKYLSRNRVALTRPWARTNLKTTLRPVTVYPKLNVFRHEISGWALLAINSRPSPLALGRNTHRFARLSHAFNLLTVYSSLLEIFRCVRFALRWVRARHVFFRLCTAARSRYGVRTARLPHVGLNPYLL